MNKDYEVIRQLAETYINNTNDFMNILENVFKAKNDKK